MVANPATPMRTLHPNQITGSPTDRRTGIPASVARAHQPDELFKSPHRVPTGTSAGHKSVCVSERDTQINIFHPDGLRIRLRRDIYPLVQPLRRPARFSPHSTHSRSGEFSSGFAAGPEPSRVDDVRRRFAAICVVEILWIIYRGARSCTSATLSVPLCLCAGVCVCVDLSVFGACSRSVRCGCGCGHWNWFETDLRHLRRQDCALESDHRHWTLRPNRTVAVTQEFHSD